MRTLRTGRWLAIGLLIGVAHGAELRLHHVFSDGAVLQQERAVAVRYAWANNPAGRNLYNAEGLPAVPFRTDDFTEKTSGYTTLFIDQ